jgi:hypothetical protein
MGIFRMIIGQGCALYQVQVAFGPDAEPGMLTIVKGFGYGIQSDDLLVEMGTGLQVHHPEGDMIEGGLLGSACKGGGKNEYTKNEFAHTGIYGKGTIKIKGTAFFAEKWR